ncbi:ProQ/FINO family protein [Methylosinus sp. PW1]|uniref:ProQ/FINO family protein n=1 Tax=Methylosinus sp. PW1 TaxID=107636 RepID=UPI00056AB9AD|nr:ProQ/FINO family protein [Methylosinus sp. PW1]
MTDTTERQGRDQARRSIDREAQKRSHAEVRALLDELIDAFPACFKPHGVKDQPPLAIGVEADILLRRPHIDSDRLGRALQVYTAGPEYYRSVIAGLPRVDLDGVARAAITSEEIGQAERLLLEFESRARSRKIPASEGHAVLAELVTSFPACFKPRDVRGRPAVAIGIHSDILERRPDLDLAKVRKALWVYVTGLDYLSGMIPGAPRIDLDGAVTQFVTEQEATNARRRLAFLRDRIKAARIAAENKVSISVEI